MKVLARYLLVFPAIHYIIAGLTGHGRLCNMLHLNAILKLMGGKHAYLYDLDHHCICIL